jgi:hypothetical protein
MSQTSPIDLSFLDGDRPAAPWDAAEAICLEIAADGLVERLGVPGTDPVIRAPAARAVAAHLRHDLAGVRAAVAEVEWHARALAAGQRADRCVRTNEGGGSIRSSTGVSGSSDQRDGQAAGECRGVSAHAERCQSRAPIEVNGVLEP